MYNNIQLPIPKLTNHKSAQRVIQTANTLGVQKSRHTSFIGELNWLIHTKWLDDSEHSTKIFYWLDCFSSLIYLLIPSSLFSPFRLFTVPITLILLSSLVISVATHSVKNVECGFIGVWSISFPFPPFSFLSLLPFSLLVISNGSVHFSTRQSIFPRYCWESQDKSDQSIHYRISIQEGTFYFQDYVISDPFSLPNMPLTSLIPPYEYSFNLFNGLHYSGRSLAQF